MVFINKQGAPLLGLAKSIYYVQLAWIAVALDSEILAIIFGQNLNILLIMHSILKITRFRNKKGCKRRLHLVTRFLGLPVNLKSTSDCKIKVDGRKPMIVLNLNQNEKKKELLRWFLLSAKEYASSLSRASVWCYGHNYNISTRTSKKKKKKKTVRSAFRLKLQENASKLNVFAFISMALLSNINIFSSLWWNQLCY